jgi:N-acetyl-gamma-glutamyl-phosphate reductase
MSHAPHPIAIVGASGYIGEELVRLLIGHPGVRIAAATSRQYAGKTLGEVFPQFARKQKGTVSELVFTPSAPAEIISSGAETVFLALPHGLAAEYAVPLVEAGLRVIDLSADFRLRDAAVYKEFYGHDHPAPALLSRAVYGLPERYRREIRESRLIACPGCYPTSILLPLLPLLTRGLIEPQSILVTALSGVSGAGRKVDLDYLYAECNENARPYGVPKHRHLSEIEQELGLAAGQPLMINFTPILAPLNRGMLTTTYAQPTPGTTGEAIAAAYAEQYADEPFVRVLEGAALPAVRSVAWNNYLDLAWRLDPRTGRLLLMSVQDNLTKGAAGQGVQNLNIALGLEETTGLV